MYIRESRIASGEDKTDVTETRPHMAQFHFGKITYMYIENLIGHAYFRIAAEVHHLIGHIYIYIMDIGIDGQKNCESTYKHRFIYICNLIQQFRGSQKQNIILDYITCKFDVIVHILQLSCLIKINITK